MSATVISKNILLVGNSFGGYSTLKSLVINLTNTSKTYLNPTNSQLNVNITLLEPRDGLVNILGIPLSIIDPKYAATTYFNFDQNTTNLPINSKDSLSLSNHVQVKINHVKEFCRFLHPDHAITDKDQVLNFDYCVLATGRKRDWPFDPKGLTKNEFIKEMEESLKQIEDAKSIVVVGGGALGVEVAGEIKQHYPDKSVKLIHPHATILKEPKLPKEFTETSTKLLQDKIGKENTLLNTRVLFEEKKKGEESITVVTNNPQNKLKCDLVLWCIHHSNNIKFLDYKDSKFADSINEKNELKINADCSVKGFENKIFATGDITDLDVIKSAGGAVFCGNIIGENITKLILAPSEILNQVAVWGPGMAITFGNNTTISYQRDTQKTEVNNPEILEFYKTYCNSYLAANLGLQ
ncbi:uncharacterized protein ASCRUDRAFT_6085 [Ascoidea rubescens DSM 1968]|uniref:FAD/NAD(P)-binding domain-containing protein n=1 Tax=Ascoidea rubescens DSM 1968 TaxID=1344418 RepID=A0A1D2VRN0_9ASCO|nr:hypothetical protein ASCRUDRAFT_6085 [Ascoidea rubescens DSM 1968]ODV64227.1 hypothetical protein ASCRUDRAFT_6085 [Ascoidea rubescens DSM 1968]